MTAPAPVRIAVVGAGHLGRHHARVAASAPGMVLAGVHDHHAGRAEELARERGAAVLPDPSAVAAAADAVVIATPTSSHAELARFFLEAGRDVLVEKPIASSVAEANSLIALARSRGRILSVGHVERYNPAVEAVLSRVTAPLFIEGHRLGVFTARSLDVDVVLDLMIHDLQIVQALVRRPVREVRAAGVPILSPRIDIASARIAFEGGCVANLTASRVSDAPLRKLRVFAPSLACSIDTQARSVEVHRLARTDGRVEIVREPLAVGDGDPLERELSDFAGAVRERRDTAVPGEVGRDALALAEQVLAAVEAHRRETELEP